MAEAGLTFTVDRLPGATSSSPQAPIGGNGPLPESVVGLEGHHLAMVEDEGQFLSSRVSPGPSPMSTHAFVFARGGSKGLPRKNLMEIAGLPLVAYSIRLAAKLAAIDAIFVSTDDGEIATVALEHGARVIDRPAELATDTAPEWLAWRHAVDWVEREQGAFERFVSLPATAPLRAPEDVEHCLSALTPDTDLVLTVSAARRNPWLNMVVADETRQVRLANAGADVSRRQDAPPVFDVATVAYVTRPAFIREASSFWAGVVRAVEVPTARAIDIDDALDFNIARFLLEQAPHLLGGPLLPSADV